jgi:hypothetical protein
MRIRCFSSIPALLLARHPLPERLRGGACESDCIVGVVGRREELDDRDLRRLVPRRGRTGEDRLGGHLAGELSEELLTKPCDVIGLDQERIDVGGRDERPRIGRVEDLAQGPRRRLGLARADRDVREAGDARPQVRGLAARHEEAREGGVDGLLALHGLPILDRVHHEERDAGRKDRADDEYPPKAPERRAVT